MLFCGFGFSCAYSGLVGMMLLGGGFCFFFCLQRVGILEDLRGGVLPDGTQRIGEEGDCRSGAASSLLPYPPRPPTPPPLTGLVWVRTNILRKVEGWMKSFVQL